MSSIKTAVSLQKPLFDQADALARQMNISRSRLYLLALEDFIQRHQNQQLLEQINDAYRDAPDPAELLRLRAMRHHQRRIVEGDW